MLSLYSDLCNTYIVKKIYDENINPIQSEQNTLFNIKKLRSQQIYIELS